MARINLLPWREERRKQRQQEFYVILAGAAMLGLVGFIAINWQIGQMQDYQENRNQLLRNEIVELNRQIKRIEDLESKRAGMLARKVVIEELQKSRSEIVHLFDQVVRTIPDGVRLDNAKQQGKRLTLDGVAESNAKVSAYMRSLEASPWMRAADLSLTQAEGEGRRNIYKFKLEVLVGPENPDADATPDQGIAQ